MGIDTDGEEEEEDVGGPAEDEMVSAAKQRATSSRRGAGGGGGGGSRRRRTCSETSAGGAVAASSSSVDAAADGVDDDTGLPFARSIFFSDASLSMHDVCSTCGSLGLAEEGRLIFCVQCGEGHHPYCLGVSIADIDIDRFKCIDCVTCEECSRGDSEDRMLVCDTCQKGMHTFCLQPPLPVVPKGAWRCAECAPRPPRAARNGASGNFRGVPEPLLLDECEVGLVDEVFNPSERRATTVKRPNGKRRCCTVCDGALLPSEITQRYIRCRSCRANPQPRSQQQRRSSPQVVRRAPPNIVSRPPITIMSRHRPTSTGPSRAPVLNDVSSRPPINVMSRPRSTLLTARRQALAITELAVEVPSPSPTPPPAASTAATTTSRSRQTSNSCACGRFFVSKTALRAHVGSPSCPATVKAVVKVEDGTASQPSPSPSAPAPSGPTLLQRVERRESGLGGTITAVHTSELVEVTWDDCTRSNEAVMANDDVQILSSTFAVFGRVRFRNRKSAPAPLSAALFVLDMSRSTGRREVGCGYHQDYHSAVVAIMTMMHNRGEDAASRMAGGRTGASAPAATRAVRTLPTVEAVVVDETTVAPPAGSIASSSAAAPTEPGSAPTADDAAADGGASVEMDVDVVDEGSKATTDDTAAAPTHAGVDSGRNKTTQSENSEARKASIPVAVVIGEAATVVTVQDSHLADASCVHKRTASTHPDDAEAETLPSVKHGEGVPHSGLASDGVSDQVAAVRECVAAGGDTDDIAPADCVTTLSSVDDAQSAAPTESDSEPPTVVAVPETQPSAAAETSDANSATQSPLASPGVRLADGATVAVRVHPALMRAQAVAVETDDTSARLSDSTEPDAGDETSSATATMPSVAGVEVVTVETTASLGMDSAVADESTSSGDREEHSDALGVIDVHDAHVAVVSDVAAHDDTLTPQQQTTTMPPCSAHDITTTESPTGESPEGAVVEDAAMENSDVADNLPDPLIESSSDVTAQLTIVDDNTNGDGDDAMASVESPELVLGTDAMGVTDDLADEDEQVVVVVRDDHRDTQGGSSPSAANSVDVSMGDREFHSSLYAAMDDDSFSLSFDTPVAHVSDAEYHHVERSAHESPRLSTAATAAAAAAAAAEVDVKRASSKKRKASDSSAATDGEQGIICPCGRRFASAQALGGHRGKCKLPRDIVKGGRRISSSSPSPTSQPSAHAKFPTDINDGLGARADSDTRAPTSGRAGRPARTTLKTVAEVPGLQPMAAARDDLLDLSSEAAMVALFERMMATTSDGSNSNNNNNNNADPSALTEPATPTVGSSTLLIGASDDGSASPGKWNAMWRSTDEFPEDDFGQSDVSYNADGSLAFGAMGQVCHTARDDAFFFLVHGIFMVC